MSASRQVLKAYTQIMIKRFFDIFFSFLGVLILLPFFLIISLFILIDSRGKAIYLQKRVGKDNQDFYLIKFRTMISEADKKGLLTIGNKDARITKMGHFLRKFKIDEFPQLINVLKGDMSIVGPRPEVRKYVNMYNEEQKKVLVVRPGITDYASIKYFHENELLGKVENPEQIYISEVMPAKLKINLEYVRDQKLGNDFKIIFMTILKIVAKPN